MSSFSKETNLYYHIELKRCMYSFHLPMLYIKIMYFYVLHINLFNYVKTDNWWKLVNFCSMNEIDLLTRSITINENSDILLPKLLVIKSKEIVKYVNGFKKVSTLVDFKRISRNRLCWQVLNTKDQSTQTHHIKQGNNQAKRMWASTRVYDDANSRMRRSHS